MVCGFDWCSPWRVCMQACSISTFMVHKKKLIGFRNKINGLISQLWMKLCFRCVLLCHLSFSKLQSWKPVFFFSFSRFFHRLCTVASTENRWGPTGKLWVTEGPCGLVTDQMVKQGKPRAAPCNRTCVCDCWRDAKTLMELNTVAHKTLMQLKCLQSALKVCLVIYYKCQII